MSALEAARRLAASLPVREHRICDEAHKTCTGGTTKRHAVIVNGITYHSISAACRGLGISEYRLKAMLDDGRADYA